MLALGIYVEVLQRWFGDITGVFARGKVLHAIRQGYEVIVPDLLTVLCQFANGAEGVLEFSGIDALASGDRLEVYGDAGTMTYDFGSDAINVGRVGDRALHAMEITPELEGGWHVEDDFIAAVKSKGRDQTAARFRSGRALHAGCPGCRRFPRPQRVGRDQDLTKRIQVGQFEKFWMQVVVSGRWVR